MSTKLSKFRLLEISRLRMTTDGEGVTTLVGGHGCPLKCRCCINDNCHGELHKTYTLDELYNEVKIDSLYFEATGGGVTFGGGEPLLQAEFILDFIKYIRNNGHLWRFWIETSLAVEWSELEPLIDQVDGWIIDLKDCDETIYKAYTGVSGRLARENLARLAELCPDKLHVRLPKIPGFNNEENVRISYNFVQNLGIKRIEKFEYSVGR